LTLTRLGVLFAVVTASVAHAQVPVFSRTTQAYQPLVGAQALTFPTTDEGFVALTLPFVFPIGGASYQTVYVHVNGQVLLTLPSFCLPTATVCSTKFQKVAIPNGAQVNNHLSPFWDDLELRNGAQIRTQSSPTEVTIEWANLERQTFTLPPVAGPYVLSFQLTLQATGNFLFHYGPTQVNTATQAAAVVGYQVGNRGSAVLNSPAIGANCTPTTQSQCCGAALNPTFCTLPAVVPNTLVRFEPPAQPDLITESVSIANFQLLQPSGDFQFDVRATLRNYSTSPTSPWVWRAYLSTDRFKDASDVVVFESAPTVLAAQTSQLVVGQAFTTTPPATGDFFVLVEADALNQVAEFSETNNLASIPTAVTNGVDLVATGITGVPVSGPDSVDAVRLQYFNRGASNPGSIRYRVMLSSVRDAGFFVYPDGGPTDLLAADGGVGPGVPGFPVITLASRSLTGAEAIDETVTLTMPSDAPQGDYFYVLQLDPGAAVHEVNERNNVIFSTSQVSVRRADLLLEAIAIIDPVTRVPVREALLGEPYLAVVRYRNQGGGAARNFRVGVILSTDSVLSLLSDVVMAEQLVPLAQTSTTSTVLEVPFSLPVVDRNDAGLPSGNNYVFVSLDTLGAVVESNKGNNSLVVGPVRALAPAADYAVSTLQAPASAGVGEALAVFRTIRNVGNRDAPVVPVRYFASANTIITTSDVPLEVVLPDGGASTSTSIALTRGAADSRAELVRLPSAMPSGAYFIGCLVDPANVVPELGEDNNALASAPVQVFSSSLRVERELLQDVTVGRPAYFQLNAAGERGPSTWAVEATQGELPAGLTLSPAGVLSGTPTGVGGTGVRAFTVTVRNDGRQASARLVLRVLPATAQVEVTTGSLPPFVNSPAALLQFPLGAAGGSRPYRWRVAQGALPAGMTFSVDGVITGAPRAGVMNGVFPITFEVRDGFGSTARKELTVRLVAAGSIVLRTTRVADGLVGATYAQDIAVQNGDGTAAAGPVKWTVTGALPPGLTGTEVGDVYGIAGTPTRAGTFTFNLTAEDARGRKDSLDYTVTIFTNRFRVVGAGLPSSAIVKGQRVEASFTTVPASQSGATFSLGAGALPPGLSLSSAGVLSGTVEDADTAVGTWTFTVEARDPLGAVGLAPFAVVVERPAQVIPRCQSASGPLSLGLLAAWGLLRRRRVRPA